MQVARQAARQAARQPARQAGRQASSHDFCEGIAFALCQAEHSQHTLCGKPYNARPLPAFFPLNNSSTWVATHSVPA